jgi:uncharacterized protein (TIGR00369 family)
MSQHSPDKKSESDFEINPPEPFRLSVRRGPFTTHNGPWYHWADGETFRQGVRLQRRHCNSRDICHGGFLCSLADGLAATAIFRNLKRSSVTMKLNTEFLGSARAGDWLQGTGWLVRATPRMAFVEARGWVGEAVDMPKTDFVFTASAVFRLFDPVD